VGDANFVRRIRRDPVAIDRHFSLIVFDLDGTLVDSRRDLADAANQVLEENGGAPHSEEGIGRMVGDGAATLVARAFAAAGIPQPPHALSRFLEVYNGRLLHHTRPYAGIPTLIESLQPKVTLALLTNKPLEPTLAILDAFGWLGVFGARVVGGDGPFARKPDPAGLRALVHQAAASSGQTLMIGDSVVDWETAAAAGTPACIARYGFGAHAFPWNQLRPEDFAIDRPEDLLQCL
jgi:phosphoglycolate phosphatase